MTGIELLTLLKKCADDYSKDAKKSIARNDHMNDIKIDETIEQKVIDAVLVDYINYIAARNGIDYGLYTSDLRK